VLGGEEGIGQSVKQVMSRVELGRVNVAARAAGLAECRTRLGRGDARLD
jgi:alkylation response protein AidB-like acyl-CoA dehydrogenase